MDSLDNEQSWEVAAANYYGETFSDKDDNSSVADSTSKDDQQVENDSETSAEANNQAENEPKIETENDTTNGQSNNEAEKQPIEETKTNENQPQETNEAKSEPQSQPMRATDYREAYSAVRQDLMSKFPFDSRIMAGGEEITDYKQLLEFENPKTGKAFTEHEAADWLLKESQKLHEEQSRYEAEIDRRVSLNIDFTDSVEQVMREYGDFLEKNPELRDQLYREYMNVVSVDTESGTVEDVRINPKDFYDFQLKPYLELDKMRKEAEVKQSKIEQLESNQKRKNEQADRSDVLKGGDITQSDKDEWEDAVNSYENKYKTIF